MTDDAVHRRYPPLFWALFAVAAVARVTALAHFPNIMSSEAEAYSKLQLFMQWEANSNWYPDTNFGPVHMLLFWPTAKLFGHAALPNRIVTLLLSLATLLPLFDLVRRVTDESVALVTTALWSLSSLLTIVGVITLAEGPCLFFLISAMALFDPLEDLHEPWRWRRAVLFALCLSAAMGLRYETWMFLPVWPLVLWKQRGFAKAAAVGAMIAAFPVIHMAVTWSITGHPLHFVMVSASTTSLNASVTPWDERALLWFQALSKIEGLPLYVTGMVGVVYSLVSGRGRRLAGFHAWYLIVVEIQALRAAMAPELHRYATFLVALSLPPAAALLRDLARGLIRRKESYLLAVGAALMLSATSVFYFQQVDQEVSYFDEAFVVARSLRTAIGPEDRVMMGYECHPLIVVESGWEWRNFKVMPYPDRAQADAEGTRRLIEKWNPTHILATRQDPSFTTTVPITFCSHTELFGRVFEPQFSYGSWCLLRQVGAGSAVTSAPEDTSAEPPTPLPTPRPFSPNGP